VAVSIDDRHWFLLNASPDLRAQIEATSALHPREGLRHTPIAGVVLTNADLDHVLGLLLLREFQPLRLYSTAAVRRILLEDNSAFGMLRQFEDQLAWEDLTPGTRFRLRAADPAAAPIEGHAVPVAGSYPAYVSAARRAELAPKEAVLGLVLTAPGGARLAYFPGLPDVSEEWLAQVRGCDVLLVDGTFWTDDELVHTRGSGKTARQMGHIPLSGPNGSLARLAVLEGTRKIFVHVNNTNPMLDEDGAELRAVRDAGFEVARDGLEIAL
jgi:pyrroloquinoline quinone biosynthesis protein B